MKLKLMRDSRPYGRTGDTIDVSPELSEFLLSIGIAEPAEIREQVETPEKAAKITARKTVRTKGK